MGEPKRWCSSQKTPQKPPESGGSLLPKCAHSLKTQDQGALLTCCKQSNFSLLCIVTERYLALQRGHQTHAMHSSCVLQLSDNLVHNCFTIQRQQRYALISTALIFTSNENCHVNLPFFLLGRRQKKWDSFSQLTKAGWGVSLLGPVGDC